MAGDVTIGAGGVAIIELELHVVDQHPGEWCPYCLLPSGLRVEWVAVDQRTLRPHFRGEVRCCECGWRDHGGDDGS